MLNKRANERLRRAGPERDCPYKSTLQPRTAA
jgi:hypothetical protein